MSEAARKNGQPCARCGMKAGAHDWRNPHPKACTEWVTAAGQPCARDPIYGPLSKCLVNQLAPTNAARDAALKDLA